MGFENPEIQDIRVWPIRGFRNYLIFHRSSEETLRVMLTVSTQLLDLKHTQVMAAGVAELHQALPQCQIVSDHGTLEPTAAAP